MKIICLPYAGGSGLTYSKWKKYLEPRVELVTIEYSGRGRRYKEGLIDGFDANLDDVLNRIIPEIDNEYVIFGHSMGAIYAFEVVSEIEKRGLLPPRLLIVSGAMAPYEQDKII